MPVGPIFRMLDEEYIEYVQAKRESEKIIKEAYKKIQNLSQEMKEVDEKNQIVTVQMYLIEIMLENLKQECNVYLGGKYRDAVNDEISDLKRSISRVNDKWEDYRKSFI